MTWSKVFVMEVNWTYIYSSTSSYVEVTWDWLHQYVDIYYLNWLVWVFYPLILTFLLPAILLILVYASALFLYLYRLRHLLRDAYTTNKHFWDWARHFLAALWDAQGKIWHGFEIHGLENIPDSGPAVIVYYHGAIPIDFYYILAHCLLHKKRHIRAVGDRFLFKIPGFKLLMDVFCVTPGTVTRGVELMKDGHLLAIAPGGVREAYFSDEFYELLWGKRVGFAKIALEAKVPIIPMYTQNCREAFRSLSIGRSYLRRLYEWTRLPVVPIYGGFPVKMRTFIGDPIPYDPNLTPEQLAQKAKKSIQQLIKTHQRIPGNILKALMERFYTPDHCKIS